MRDDFPTPKAVADAMAASVSSTRVLSVADFACGEGQLLQSAEERWPCAKFLASDKDPSVVQRIRRKFPHWRVGRCDFLSPRSRSACLSLKQHAKRISVVLLNPPFSCRGAAKVHVPLPGPDLHCSISMAFVVASTVHLDSDGQLIAVLPASTLHSLKDRSAVSWLRSNFALEVIDRLGRTTFRHCYPQTVIIRVSAHSHDQSCTEQSNRILANAATYAVRLVRGTIPVHSLNGHNGPPAIPVIHTTSLQAGRVLPSQLWTPKTNRPLTGPCVLLPRVGKPSKGKVSLHSFGGQAALSDCVIALCCDNLEAARQLQRTLVANWGIVSRRYGGTCAQYITVEGLRDALGELGVILLSDQTPFNCAQRHLC